MIINDVRVSNQSQLQSGPSIHTDMYLEQQIFLSALAGNNPLRGVNIDEFGPSFPPMSDAYDLELRRTVHQVWRKMATPGRTRRLQEGVYAFGGGPR